MDFIAQIVVSGLTIGAVYALVGLGFVIIYLATKTLNFAHGEVLMLGAIIGLQLHGVWGLGYWTTFLTVMLALGFLGVLIERVAYRPLARAPITTVILATAAVGAIIRSAVRITQEQQISYFPPMLSTEPFQLAGVSLTPLDLGIVGIGLGFVLTFTVLFRYSSIGRAMRAVSENPDAASLVGIKVSRVNALTWAIASAFGAVAGLLVAPILLITPDMGVIAIKGFVAAIIGGFSSPGGAIVGGLLLGVVENLIGVYISTSYKDVFTFLLLLAILFVRPAGLFGKVGGRRV